MNKYARTKDGIYTITGNYQLNNINYYTIEERISSISEENIIKQADSIEELGDTAIVIDNKTEKVISITKTIQPDKLYLYIVKNFSIYIAIWTEWGLKYVAKMNEKGEFELI